MNISGQALKKKLQFYVIRKLNLNKEAIKCYDQALNLNPNDCEALNNKGLALHFLHNQSDLQENQIELKRRSNAMIQLSIKILTIQKLLTIKELLYSSLHRIDRYENSNATRRQLNAMIRQSAQILAILRPSTIKEQPQG